MFFYAKRIIKNAQENGLFRTLLKYIQNELITCRFRTTVYLRKLLKFFIFQFNITTEKKRILFIFDTNVTPLTFDIIGYLSQCEVFRRNQKANSIFFVILENKQKKLKPNLQKISQNAEDNFSWRINNLIVKSLGLFPYVKGYLTTNDFNLVKKIITSKDIIYPESYINKLPRQPSHKEIRKNNTNNPFPLIIINPKILKVVKNDLQRMSKGKKIITISLTKDKMEYQNNLQAWIKFVESLDHIKFYPLFVADHSIGVNGVLSKYRNNFYYKATWDLQLRAAAYELSYLNMSVGHGPMELCYYNNKTKYIIFFKSKELDYKPNIERKLSNWSLGSDLSFSTKNQKIIWEEDNFKNISEAFNRYLKGKLK